MLYLTNDQMNFTHYSFALIKKILTTIQFMDTLILNNFPEILYRMLNKDARKEFVKDTLV